MLQSVLLELYSISRKNNAYYALSLKFTMKEYVGVIVPGDTLKMKILVQNAMMSVKPVLLEGCAILV